MLGALVSPTAKKCDSFQPKYVYQTHTPQNTYFLDSLWYFCHSANIHTPTLQHPPPHWCWAWPCDLLWPMGFCQCDVSRSLNHACVIGFGSWAPVLCTRRTCLGGLCPIGFGHRTDNRWSRPTPATLQPEVGPPSHARLQEPKHSQPRGVRISVWYIPLSLGAACYTALFSQ